MDEKINTLASALADRFGERALEVVIRQFDAAEGEARLVWGQIMEWLILLAEEAGRRPIG